MAGGPGQATPAVPASPLASLGRERKAGRPWRSRGPRPRPRMLAPSPMADFYPLPPFFLGMGLLLALAATPLCRPADAPPGQAASRMPALDGLRGILALAVFFHHAAIYPRLLAGQGWGLPPAHAYAVMGKGAVGMFFIITGYLFWAKLLREEGRPSWLALYAGRLFRIGPLYLVVILAMLALLFGRDGGELREPATQVAGQVGEWLLLGAGNRPDVNAHAGTNLLTAGVTWTLQYEWIFYASLPLAALLARTGRRETWLTLALLLLCLAWAGGHLGPWAGADEPGFVTLFLIGMSCASLEARGLGRTLSGPGTSPRADRAASVLVVGLVAIWFGAVPLPNDAIALAVMGLVFWLVRSGCTVFGLLTLRATRRLGDASYGIYLLHGLVLALAFAFPWVKQAAATPLGFWSVVIACGIPLIALATLLHALVEQPGIRAGRRVARWIGNRRFRTAPAKG